MYQVLFFSHEVVLLCSVNPHHHTWPFTTTAQAKTRLRALGLPVTLFGETQAQRSARLLQAEEDKGHHHDDFTLADGHNVVSEKVPSAVSLAVAYYSIHLICRRSRALMGYRCAPFEALWSSWCDFETPMLVSSDCTCATRFIPED